MMNKENTTPLLEGDSSGSGSSNDNKPSTSLSRRELLERYKKSKQQGGINTKRPGLTTTVTRAPVDLLKVGNKT